ncbi:MAG: endonuclease NucS domain-containing protein [Dongiaceae bacterium]
MVQRHLVVIPRVDGGVEMHPLKKWLRHNPEHIPSGLDPESSTSWQLRSGLQKLGWVMEKSPDQVRLLMPGTLQPDLDHVLGEAEDEETSSDSLFFGLEHQLRDFLAQHITSLSINQRRLKLYVDESGQDGVEFETSVGRIDILTVDDEGNFYVFELKRAASPDRAIGQLARYMGWVKDTIGKNVSVHGVIVAQSIGDNLRYARMAVPNITLLEYEVLFKLKPV